MTPRKDYAELLKIELQRVGLPIATRAIRFGDRMFSLTDRQLVNIIRRINVPNDRDKCWKWTGCLFQKSGYGQFGFRCSGVSVTITAHRVAYQILKGPIPDGLTLDHVCFVRHCVNIGHLDPCSVGENSRRSPRVLSSINRAKTACPKGHPYDIVIPPPSPAHEPRRGCRTCSREKGRRWAERNRGRLREYNRQYRERKKLLDATSEAAS